MLVVALDLVIGDGSAGDVEDKTEGVTDLTDHCGADISGRFIDSSDRHGSDVLALGDRGVAQPVGTVGFDRDLC
jgi:hypothetical protein